MLVSPLTIFLGLKYIYIYRKLNDELRIYNLNSVTVNDIFLIITLSIL